MKNQELFHQADYYKNLIDTNRPFSAEQQMELDHYFKDCHEASGQAQAYDYIISVAETDRLDITEEIIKQLHLLIYQKINQEEAGQYRNVQVYLSDMEYMPPKAEEVPHLMEHFINQMQSSKRFMHPIEFAAICHKRLVDIQPFKDGNDRIARLIMNLILVNAGYGITFIPPALRGKYINALKLSQKQTNPDIDALIELITECVIEAEKDYCRLLGIE